MLRQTFKDEGVGQVPQVRDLMNDIVSDAHREIIVVLYKTIVKRNEVKARERKNTGE